ncbi:MAG: cyclic-di-AMP phosphodiesterase [Bacillota bacterium]|nr:cyclic-di-AMP phosphodiesterase [Bacillota bacterium]
MQDPGGRRPSPWHLALALTVVLILCLARYNGYLALFGAVAGGGIVLYARAARPNVPVIPGRKEVAPPPLESAVRQALQQAPFPALIIDASGRILFANRALRELFPGVEHGRRLEEAAHTLSDPTDGATLALGERVFRVAFREYESTAGRARALYLADITEQKGLEDTLEAQAPVLGLLQVDNYEEVLAGTPEGQRPLLKAAIDKLLGDWAQAAGIYLHKYGEDRYVLFFTQSTLKALTEERFALLDRVKEIALGNTLPVTVSLGLGSGSRNFLEVGSFARTALDLALGRGGDQAVLKTPKDLTYYGGKTKAPEKRTKVKARVIAQALRELIAGADKVLVMGHRHADPDSLGAGVGLVKAARDLGRPAYYVLDEVTPAVAKLHSYLLEHESYQDVFLESGAALRQVTADTLIVIVDTHKPSLVEAPRLLARTRKVVVIDHHRRAEEFIADPTLVYLESYASSTAELVAEILQYLDEVHVTSLEATALLAGLTVDTKNFAFQTGVRTFEAAAYLRRSGADARLVQSLFQDDLASFLRRAEAIKGAEVLPGGLAVTEVDIPGPEGQLLAAQVANELLNIEEVKASFVVYPYRDGAAVSARSLGDVNVQVLMEKLGGGGHLTIAGAQLGGLSVAAAREKVRAVLATYLREEEMP